MAARRRAILVASAWVLGWSLLTAAVTGTLQTAWPTLPIWIVPAASAGLVLLLLGGVTDLWAVARLGTRRLIEKGRR